MTDALGIGEYEPFLAGLFAIAWADREVQPEEQELLRKLIEDLNLPDQLRRKADGWFKEPLNLDAVDWSRLPVEGQAFLYRTAIQVAKADGVVKRSERDALERLKGMLDVPPDALAAIERDEVVAPEDLGL